MSAAEGGAGDGRRAKADGDSGDEGGANHGDERRCGGELGVSECVLGR